MVQVLKGSNIVTAVDVFSDLINRNRLNTPSTGELEDADIIACIPNNFKGAIIAIVFDMLFPNLNMHWKSGRVKKVPLNAVVAGNKKTVYIFNFLEDEKFINENAERYQNLKYVNMKTDDILSNLLTEVKDNFKVTDDCGLATVHYLHCFIECAIKYTEDKNENIFNIVQTKHKTFFMLDVYIRVYGLAHFMYNFSGKEHDMFKLYKGKIPIVSMDIPVSENKEVDKYSFRLVSELLHTLYGATMLHTSKVKYSGYTSNGESSLNNTKVIVVHMNANYIYNLLEEFVNSRVKFDSIIVVDLENTMKVYFIDNKHEGILSAHGDIIRSVVNRHSGVNKGIPHINVSTMEEVISIISAYRERMTLMADLKKVINKLNLYIITKVVRAVAFNKYDEAIFKPFSESRTDIKELIPYCIYRDVVFPDISVDDMNGFKFSGDKELRIRLLDTRDGYFSDHKDVLPTSNNRISFYGGINIVDNDTGTIFINLAGHEGTEKYMVGLLKDYACKSFPDYIFDNISFLFDDIREFESNIVAKYDTHYYRATHEAFYENGEYVIGHLKVKLDLTKLPKTIAEANNICEFLSKSKRNIEGINNLIPGFIIVDSVKLDTKPATYDAIMDLSDIK